MYSFFVSVRVVGVPTIFGKVLSSPMEQAQLSALLAVNEPPLIVMAVSLFTAFGAE
jgi:hypothetical protein